MGERTRLLRLIADVAASPEQWTRTQSPLLTAELAQFSATVERAPETRLADLALVLSFVLNGVRSGELNLRPGGLRILADGLHAIEDEHARDPTLSLEQIVYRIATRPDDDETPASASTTRLPPGSA